MVLTGWFSQPRVLATGPLRADGDDDSLAADAEVALDGALKVAFDAFDDLDLARVVGFLAVELTVEPTGAVSSAKALCDTLKVDPSEQGLLDPAEDPDDVTVRQLLHAALMEASFPTRDAPTTLTVPLAFD